MQSVVAPSFPPVDAAVAALMAVNWRAVGRRVFAAVLTAAAIAHALSMRAWHHRGRLAPMLRKMAIVCASLADRLPEPLSASSPRHLLIAALVANGADQRAVSRKNTAALITAARSAGLF